MIIQFIYNFLTSSNNHLLLQFCRWLALTLGPVPTKMAMMVTYHHHRHPPRMSFSRNFWGIRAMEETLRLIAQNTACAYQQN